MKALADTSVFVALEQRRTTSAAVPDELSVSIITVAELHFGVLMTDDPIVRAQRLTTVAFVEATFEPVPVDRGVAHRWARLVADLRRRGRRVPLNETWIAATALARGLPVATQDRDYHAIEGLEVIRV